MTRIALPSGPIIDFGNLSPEEIENQINSLQSESPELFIQSNQPARVADIFDAPKTSTDSQQVSETIEPTHIGEVESVLVLRIAKN